LQVVLEIALRHRATVSLEDARPGQVPPGSRFVVRFDRRSRQREPAL
jgi:two-component system sensor histidine kinase TctE